MHFPVRYSELCATIGIGLASLFIAYGGYMSSVWGGTSLENYSKASQMVTEANTTYLEAVIQAGADAADGELKSSSVIASAVCPDAICLIVLTGRSSIGATS